MGFEHLHKNPLVYDESPLRRMNEPFVVI